MSTFKGGIKEITAIAFVLSLKQKVLCLDELFTRIKQDRLQPERYWKTDLSFVVKLV